MPEMFLNRMRKRTEIVQNCSDMTIRFRFSKTMRSDVLVVLKALNSGEPSSNELTIFSQMLYYFHCKESLIFISTRLYLVIVTLFTDGKCLYAVSQIHSI